MKKLSRNNKLLLGLIAVLLLTVAVTAYLNTGDRASLNRFADQNQVSSYARTALSWSVAEGIIGGSSKDGRVYLNPQDNATRAQIAKVMHYFCNRYF